MSLVNDCIKVLGNNSHTLSKKDNDTLVNQLFQTFPFTEWGRLDWLKIEQNTTIHSVSEIFSTLQMRQKEIKDTVFIIWDEATKPVVESTLELILKHIEDVTIVSFDTWIFSPAELYVIEFYHDGEIKIGFCEKKQVT